MHTPSRANDDAVSFSSSTASPNCSNSSTKLGNNTWLTGSYFGSQTTSNQSGNTSNVIPVIFQPGAGYTGSLKAGSVVDSLSAAYDAQPQFESNNEPIWQLELNTSFANNDTLLARFYHATIARITERRLTSDPFQPYASSSLRNIYGTLSAFRRPAARISVSFR